MRPVWITGIGVNSALGHGQNAFWNALLEGVPAVRDWRVSAQDERQIRTAHMEYSMPAASPVASPVASPDEVPEFVRAGAAALAEALDQAGLTVPDLRAAALLVGTTSGGTMDGFVDACLEEDQVAQQRCSTSANIGSSTRWLAQYFGIQGTQATLSAACTSSTAAIAQGMFLIQQGLCEVALVGGCDQLRAADAAGFGVLRAVTKEVCRPFDAQRDGILPADGAAFLVLESATHAQQRGALPLAELISTGFSCDAHHATAPHPEGVARAMRLALQQAEIQPEQIGYVNCHGTGTLLNDKNEALAMQDVFGENITHLYATSTKSTTGHLLGTAGALEALICVQVLQQQTIPPMKTVRTLDPCVRFQAPLVAPHVCAETAPLNYVMSNSLGFGGMNTSLILRRAPLVACARFPNH